MNPPHSTYRIQFNPSFRFRDAQAIIGYLADLGAGALYASPIFQARQDSVHGYDVVDPTRINTQLGTEEEFRLLVDALRQRGISWLQDIVPNHMAFDKDNLWLMDVLEKGWDSEFRSFFDINWDYYYDELKGKVLAPFLGKFYGQALEEGELRLTFENGRFRLAYYDWRFPILIHTYPRILNLRKEELAITLRDDPATLAKFQGLIDSITDLGLKAEPENRRVQIEASLALLKELGEKHTAVRDHIEQNIRLINGTPGRPESFDVLDELLSQQIFRLSFWKVGTEEINYRRFFNINELISIRVEQEAVFQATHGYVLRLIQEGLINGLRIDHIDGLFDPEAYLQRLRELAPSAYIVVEKILDMEEKLPLPWPVQGTSGYDALNQFNGVLCRQANKKKLGRIYTVFSGLRTPYQELVHDKKRLIIGKHMAGDIDNLAHHMKSLSRRDRYGSDITLYGLKRALVEVMTYFPVYRTYIQFDTIRQQDRQIIEETIKKATDNNPGLFHELKFIENFLLLRFKGSTGKQEKKEWVNFVMRFQQFTGPLMAKGFEDTTLYIYNRLLSLNEVGGFPDSFGVSLAGFHFYNVDKQRYWPHGMNATATHDTKRGEDVRARLNVLSEIPEEWEAALKQWRRINRRNKKRRKGLAVPDANDEYFLYQTLLGTWPFEPKDMEDYPGRIKNYIVKAVREAKVHTAWLQPDEEYENAYGVFVERLLDSRPFMEAFLPLQKKVAHFGMFNSLTQCLLQLACPGVPDIYQGCELWNFSLVDPDNRRPVDYQLRQNMLSDILSHKTGVGFAIPWLEDLLKTKEDGKIKLFLIYCLLQQRQKKHMLWSSGEYIPIQAEGEFKDNIIAFGRCHRQEKSVVAAPRFLTGVVESGQDPLGDSVWGKTYLRIPESLRGDYTDIFTGQRISFQASVPAGQIFRVFPVGCFSH